jgi:hypothetical protein
VLNLRAVNSHPPKPKSAKFQLPCFGPELTLKVALKGVGEPAAAPVQVAQMELKGVTERKEAAEPQIADTKPAPL